ncbi:uncharacterized protein HD556DRAFT_722003 [Suillus plorans]|uniref:Uncharacterized protein n=1 Tax=Suillus plorans TaxID=116603 RepID=A0A9P7J4X0_9AGAM|nr:uncharacterized protein HD556DRAFT_722003 [Suillus plorans]KAG1802939.1 hypothetical protein HD556DRAFT_722003 [Suillus plorans]
MRHIRRIWTKTALASVTAAHVPPRALAVLAPRIVATATSATTVTTSQNLRKYVVDCTSNSPWSSYHQCDCGPSGTGCTCPKNNCKCDNCDSCVNKQHSQCDCGPSGIDCTCPKNNCNCDNCDSCVNKQHSSQCDCKGAGVSCGCTNQQRACNCVTK